ncbi:MAG: HNH endonuclease [Phycisphaerales bacterium]|nr:HNH endonuclease [Phycisphaerales bacterium]
MVFATTPSIAYVDSLVSGLNCHVLVLNRNYMAVRVASVKRAFSLLYRDLAEVIHIENDQYLSYDFDSWRQVSEHKQRFEPHKFDWVRTVHFSMAVPRIIRLVGYDRLPRKEVKFNRRNIFARDGNRCQYCGGKFSTSELSLDHVVPKSQGGRTIWTNIVCCCLECNVRKGGRTPEQAAMHIIKKPTKPKRSPTINLQLSSERYRSWKQFLDHAYWSVELK